MNVPLKQFVLEEAARCAVSVSAIRMRLHRGGWYRLRLRRVNPRCIFVQEVKHL